MNNLTRILKHGIVPTGDGEMREPWYGFREMSECLLE